MKITEILVLFTLMAKDNINKMVTAGPLQENLDKWRAEDKSTTETQLKTNSFWLNYLTGQLQNQESPEQLNDYATLRDKVTTEDLKAMAAKYLNGDNYIRLVLLPETAIAKSK